MTGLLVLFANNLLPIFLIAGCGFLAARAFDLQPRSVSLLAFYVFSPCLIFNLLTRNQLNPREFAQMSAFATAAILGIGLLAWVIGRLLRLERRLLMALLLASMFSNAGNFGMSLNLLAFGEKTMAYASLYFVTSALLTYTLGVFVASLGASGWRTAIISLLKAPAAYAALLALIFNYFNWRLPLPLENTVNLLSNAAVPVLLVLLGIQLQQATGSPHKLAIGLTSGLRLLAGPVLALGLSVVFGLQGAARQAGILESAMPTAITVTVLATEFDLEPAFVTAAVVTSTLLSPLTLTPLLAFLGA